MQHLKKHIIRVGSIVGTIAAITLGAVWHTGGLELDSGPLDAKTIQAAYSDETKGFFLSGLDITELPDLCRDIPKSTQSRIEHVVINHMDIEHLDRDLSCLPKLRTLNLAYNNIKSIDKLLAGPNLEQISLAHNYLVTLDNLGHHPQLTSLKLYNNRLTDVRQINAYRNLQTLLLQNNNLKDISYLRLRNIKNIQIEGNFLDPSVVNSFKQYSAQQQAPTP